MAPGDRPVAINMKTITSRIVLLIATSAVAPLLIYGYVSINRLTSGMTTSVNAGNRAVAQQVAERIAEYFQNNRRVLGSIAAQLQGTQLEHWQKERTLRNHVMDFDEFNEITIFDRDGKVLVSSRPGPPTLRLPKPIQGDVYIAPPALDADGFPSTVMALAVGGPGDQWIVAEVSLEQLWRAVDEIAVGASGFAVLLDENGRLMAHGDAAQKRLIVEGAMRTPEQDLSSSMRSEGHRIDDKTLVGQNGERRLAAAARINVPDWTVIIEQPEQEALEAAITVSRQLQFAIGIALLATVAVGWLWGRTFISRIFALTRVTRALAQGDMEARVAIRGQDEIRQLGDAFNSMADRLVELQEEIRKQERQAMFGRIAAGLVHDLSHPIQTIGNSCKLIQRIFDDPEYRATFRHTVERELATVKRVLDDLRNIAKPMPLERFSIDVNTALLEAVDTMVPHAETAGLTVRTELAHEPAYIEADLFALGRVHRNLMLNAIQATAPGGLIVAASEVHGDRVVIKIYDTGCGIPADRLHAIFDDFVTTKRRGLGLGLAISKKIVEQLGGRISVASEVGKGTTFVLDFPRAAAPPVALIAG
jgi:signal transduction histidine kinase